jgi:O-antigen ligase
VARSPHSTFLEILVEGGIVTVACFVWLLAGLGLTGKRLYESGLDHEERLYGLFLMTIVVAKSLANLFNTEFLTGDVSAYLWVSAALVAWRLAHAPEKSRAVVRPQRVVSPWRPRPGAEIRRPVTHG